MNSKPPRIFLSPPHMGNDELALVQEAFHSNYIAPLGPMVDAFEREFAAYTGIPHCLALSSGTAAMHLALRELGVGPGDKVVASSLTSMRRTGADQGGVCAVWHPRGFGCRRGDGGALSGKHHSSNARMASCRLRSKGRHLLF